MNSIQYVTKEVMEKMKKDLRHLKAIERPKTARAISEAREKGDLKENAEYDAAKNQQGLLEAKISILENTLAHTRIIDERTINANKVSILTHVRITNKQNNQQLTYQIVSPTEANIKEKKLSVDSPIGKALLGKAKGDTVQINTPSGMISFHIDNITI